MEERKHSGASSHGGGEDGAEAWEIDQPTVPVQRMTADLGLNSSYLLGHRIKPLTSAHH